jgi:DmsE family decaheme c-type cytochrome
VPLVARCEDCHREVQAEFAMPFRHPLDAGSLGAASGCTSCHPPHGLAGLRARDHLRRDACLECHRELAGPFLFEHEGSRERLCLSCHEAHGSPNRRLLTHADSRSLCSSCHMNLEDIHIQNPGSSFRNCLLCHTEIHGSDWDRELRR